MIFLSFM